MNCVGGQVLIESTADREAAVDEIGAVFTSLRRSRQQGGEHGDEHWGGKVVFRGVVYKRRFSEAGSFTSAGGRRYRLPGSSFKRPDRVAATGRLCY